LKKKLFTVLLCAVMTAALMSCDKEMPSSDEPPAAEAINKTEAEAEEAVPEKTISVSHSAGIYNADSRPEYVTFSTESGYTIKYTTSSCVAPEGKSQIAEGEIRLPYHETGDGSSECAIIRAALFDGGERVSQVYTYTYFSAPEGRFTTPVFSLISDPVGLYSDETGILVEGNARKDALKNGNPPGWVLSNTNANFYNSGREWEREVSIEFSESGSGAYTFSSNGGMRVNGGWTRANIQKSLKLFSRKDYTPDYGTFAVDLFPGYRDPNTGMTNSFANTILIRGGSNNEGNTVIGTPLQLSLCEGTRQLLPAMRPVTEYINGKYRGMFYIIEDYDADFIESHFGVPEEELAIFSGSYENYGGSMWTLDTGEEGDLTAFLALLDELGKMDMKKEENYEYACCVLDMRNFIEYICIELYCGNSDWPDNNLRVFRVKTEEDQGGVSDGRYRFLLKDLDLSFGHGHSATSNPYGVMNSSSILGIKEVFTALMKNSEFKDTVYMYMCTLASSVFSPERVQEKMDEFVLCTFDEMTVSTSQMHVGGGSISSWQSNLNSLLSYAKSREKTVFEQTERYSRNDLCEVTITLTGEGKAEIGWYPAEDGTVMKTITETKIPVECTPDAEITVTGGTYSDGYIILDGDEASVSIVFGAPEPEKTADGVVINEVSYRGSEEKFIELYNGSDKALSLDGWMIRTIISQSLDGYTIEPGGYLVISDNGDVPLAVTMSKNNTLTLYNGDEAVDSLDLFTVNRTVQYGRYPDGGEMITLYPGELTPGEENRIDEPFAWEILRSDGVMIGDEFISVSEMTQENGDYQFPVKELRSYLRDIRKVYKKEWDWADEHKDEFIPFGELEAFIDENMRIKVRYCAAANVIIIG